MIAAHISHSSDSRKAAIAAFLDAAPVRQVIYVCPKSILWQTEEIAKRARVVSFEDLDKRDTWLEVNAMIGPSTGLVMECVSRYPKITSPKFQNLQRLSKQLDHKLLVDIVPFTEGIEYVYTPYSYLDRAILGFAHWYAFREGYDEMRPDGTIVSSHDPALIAGKIGTVTTSDGYALLQDRRTLSAPISEAERASYGKKKAELFEKFDSPVKIVTRLADHVHAFKSRTVTVVEHSAGLQGRVLVLTNLGSYAAKLNKQLKKAAPNAVADSLAVAVERRDLGVFDHVVHAENPIIKSYLTFDIEAQLPRHATAWTVRGDSKVEDYLAGRWGKEIGDITAVMTAMEDQHD